MPRRPDMPCAGCGKLMWRGKGVLPAGQARCRSCRSQIHGTATRYKAGCRCADCREAKRIEMSEYVRQVKSRDGISPTQKYRPTADRRVDGECSKCGRGLTGTTLPEPVCAPCRGNRPGYNIKITAAARRAIYERDGWTCQICTEPVDPDEPVGAWDATLDHIVPRSKGGTDDDTNLRLAHRWCNSVRGDLTYYKDDDLRVA